MRYLADQAAAAGVVPDDRTILIERCRDELGDWRICVLTPFGGRIHAPWAMAVVERARAETGLDVETMWTDDGFVVRFPETDEPPDPQLMMPASDEVEALVLRQLGGTALFAAKFREAAGRALLLPKRRPGGRSPLWQQRKRAADLLAVAARFGSFPMLLEAYRECLRDVFDMPALVDTLRRIETREIKTGHRRFDDRRRRSPRRCSSATSPTTSTTATRRWRNGARRRWRSIRRSCASCSAKPSCASCSTPTRSREVERSCSSSTTRIRREAVDGVHDLLLRLGDLTADEADGAQPRSTRAAAIDELVRARRAIAVNIAGEPRVIPVEYAGRYRDALGVPLPAGLPESLLRAVRRTPALDLARRYARTHGPFTTGEFAARYALGRATAETLLKELAAAGRLLEGEFRPGGTGREWCDPEVLQSIRRRSLAKLRKEVEPVDPPVLGRLLTRWQGVVRRRAGLDALLDAIENLQGAPLPASIFESEILAARIEGYNPADLDALTAAGEVVWCGVEPLGERDGRIALYLTDHFARLRREPPPADLSPRSARSSTTSPANGASFFARSARGRRRRLPGRDRRRAVGPGVEGRDHQRHVPRAARVHAPARAAAPRAAAPAGAHFRSRRVAPPSAEGRWSLVSEPGRRSGLADRVVDRHRAAAAVALRRRHARGRRRGRHHRRLQRRLRRAQGARGRRTHPPRLFRRRRRRHAVRAAGGARPAALAARAARAAPRSSSLAATDPANPYGTILKWPGAAGENDAGRGTDAHASARSSSSSTARSARTSAAAPASCRCSCPKTSRRARRSAARSPAGWRRWRRDGRPARSTRSTASRPPNTRSRRSWSMPASALRHGLHDAARGFAGNPNFQCRLPEEELRGRWTHSATAADGMPEGDTIFRAARTLHRALAGKPVVRFESVFPALTRVHDDTPLTGRSRSSSVDRIGQAHADALLRRTGAAHAHAHERQLAHLPSRRTLAAAAPRHAHRRRDRRLRRGRLQHPGRGVHRRVESRAARGAAPPRARPARRRPSTPARRCGACRNGRRS